MPSLPGCPHFDFANIVAARKSCRICLLRDPGKIHSGADLDFDPNVVSYWSQWLEHTAPQILIVGQDFGDLAYFRRFRGTDDPENETNRFLYELLVSIGLTPTRPPQNDPHTRVYLTNSVLCLKEPPMNSPLRAPWVRACAIHHLRPLADKLGPPIVVAMGSPAWTAARIAFELIDAPEKIGTAAGGMWSASEGIQVFAVGHCGRLGQGNRPWHKQLEDWTGIGEALRNLPPDFR